MGNFSSFHFLSSSSVSGCSSPTTASRRSTARRSCDWTKIASSSHPASPPYTTTGTAPQSEYTPTTAATKPTAAATTTTQYWSQQQLCCRRFNLIDGSAAPEPRKKNVRLSEFATRWNIYIYKYIYKNLFSLQRCS